MEPILIAIILATGSPEASERALEAGAQHYRLEERSQRLQEKWLSESQRHAIGLTGSLVTVIANKRVTYSWRFP